MSEYKPTMLTEILNDDSEWKRVNSLADVRVGDIYRNLDFDGNIIKSFDGESIMYALKNPYLVNGRNCVESCLLRECRDYFTDILNNN